MSRLSKGLYTGLITGMLGLIISLAPFGIDLEERIGLDLLFRLRGTRQAPSDVVIVAIDKESARHLNISDEPEKWPRSLHAKLINKLVKKGASVIAFDPHRKTAFIPFFHNQAGLISVVLKSQRPRLQTL